MATKKKLLVSKDLHRLLSLYLIPVLLLACTVSFASIPSTPAESAASPTSILFPTVTLLPTSAPPASQTPAPSEAAVPSDPPGTIALDFVALLCNADWMNGARHLTPCPAASADHVDGYATKFDPIHEGFPANVSILLMVPNAAALFLRYPHFKVNTDDRFRTTLQCAKSAPCDVQFALDYYDEAGNFHNVISWDYKTGAPPIQVDFPLGDLAGETVDFMLTLRLFHEIESPQHDNGIWIAPHIYRPGP